MRPRVGDAEGVSRKADALEAPVNDCEFHAAQPRTSTGYRRRWPDEVRIPAYRRMRAFQPPLPPLTAVVRPRLMATLHKATRSKLSVVTAPPGYGKTTLLAQWAASRGSAGGCVRWISLTAERDHGLRFVSVLRAALGSASSPHGTVRSTPARET